MRQPPSGNEVTVTVEGDAPRLFSLPLLLPAVRASASLPLERYPQRRRRHESRSFVFAGRMGRRSSPG